MVFEIGVTEKNLSVRVIAVFTVLQRRPFSALKTKGVTPAPPSPSVRMVFPLIHLLLH